jgi:hypothetical protein
MSFMFVSHCLLMSRLCDVSVSVWRLLDFYLVPPQTLAQLVIKFWVLVIFLLSPRSLVVFVSLVLLRHLLCHLLTVQLWLLLSPVVLVLLIVAVVVAAGIQWRVVVAGALVVLISVLAVVEVDCQGEVVLAVVAVVVDLDFALIAREPIIQWIFVMIFMAFLRLIRLLFLRIQHRFISPLTIG